MGGNLLVVCKWTDDYFYEKQNDPRGLSAPAPGLHVYDHDIQTSSSIKPLDQIKPNFMWRIIRERE